MMDRRDAGFYSVLGVEKASSSSEIRSAYRKLAMKWHPDKCSRESPVAAARFQQIQEAYSVLSDGNKRILYDAGVYNSADNDAGMQEFMSEMLSMMSDANNKKDGGNSMEELENLFMKIIDADVYMASYEESGQVKQDGTSFTNHGEDHGDFDSFLQDLQFEQAMEGFCMGATGKVETPLKQKKQRKSVKKRKWNCPEKGVAASSSDYLST